MTTVNAGPAAGWVPFATPPTYRGSDPFREATSDWQLAAGHYYDNHANMPLKLLHPLPEGGSGPEGVEAYARHKWAHSQFQYRTKIKAQGGARPYHYELIGVAGTDYPTDMAIGQSYGDANYETLYWTPAAEAQNSTWTITVRVTDQTGRYVDAVFPLELDDTMFAFQNPAVAPGGTGTWADPYQNILEWYGTAYNDPAATVGKIMVYRGGTHTISAAPGESYLMRFYDKTYQPYVHIGVPGESVIWDLTNAQIDAAEFGGRCFYMADIDIQNTPGTNVNDAHGIRVVGGHQSTFHDLTFSSMDLGSVGTGNQACIYFGNPGVLRQYVVLDHIDTTSLPNVATNGFNLTTMYSTKYWCIEWCTDTTSTSAEWIFIKEGDQYGAIAYNDMTGITSAGRGVMYLGNSNTAGVNPTHIEVCYNKADYTTWLLGINQNKSGSVGPQWVFRNTLVGYTWVDIQVTDSEVELFRNVYIYSSGIDADFTIPSGETNVYETGTAGVLDVSYLLESSYLTTEGMTRGTHGHEVA